jgi:hypothetical protein
MIWSEIIRGAKIRFDFTFSVLPLFVLFSWRTSHLSSSASAPQFCAVHPPCILSHEETSEIPLSSSILLRRFPANIGRQGNNAVDLVRDTLPSWEKCDRRSPR